MNFGAFKNLVVISKMTLAFFSASFLSTSAFADESDLIGSLEYYRVSSSDRFVDVATMFHIGYVNLLAANPGINPWIPGAGTKILLPALHVLPDAPREGIVLNLAELRLYFFPPNGMPIQSYAIGIGQDGWDTPMGEATVTSKQKNPTWTPPESIRLQRPDLPRVVAPGEDNPLGNHAIYLDWPSYLIHGTNIPAGVGRRVSHGCIRMFPHDIAVLFPQVQNGTKVLVIDQPIKLGWLNGELYLEVHPTSKQHDNIEYREPLTFDPLPNVMDLVITAAGSNISRIDVRKVHQVSKDRTGIPVQISVGKD